MDEDWQNELREQIKQNFDTIKAVRAMLPENIGNIAHISIGDGCGEMCQLHYEFCPLFGAPCHTVQDDFVTLVNKNGSAGFPVPLQVDNLAHGKVIIPIDEHEKLIVPVGLVITQPKFVEEMCLNISFNNWLRKQSGKFTDASLLNVLNGVTKNLQRSLPYEEYLKTDHWDKTRKAT